MAFEVSDTINKFSDSVLKYPIVKTIAHNPIYTALVIVLIVCFIILFVFRNVEFADDETSLTSLTLRVGFYSLVITGFVIFLHNNVFLDEMKGKAGGDELSRVFDHSQSISEGKTPDQTAVLIPSNIQNPDFTK